MSYRYIVSTYGYTIRRVFLYVLVAILLISPIAAYVAVFGFEISNDHSRWGEMGAAMSGVYSPLLALATLLVLASQLRLQRLIAAYQTDQTHIEQCRADIQYYLEQLDRVLQSKDQNNNTLRQVIHHHFQPRDTAGLENTKLLALAQSLNQQYPQPMSLWSAIYPIVASLRHSGKFPYQHHAVGTVQKIIAMITMESCVSLDNFHYCLTENRTGISYEFSPLVRPTD